MVIRSPRIRMYSRSTGLPSSRLVSRSSISSAAPSGTCRVAAECASAGMASSASDAEPSRCPLTCSMSANRSLSFQRVIQDLGSDIRGEVGQVEGQRQVTEIAQPLDEHRLSPGFQLQPAGHRRRSDDEHRGAHLVADFADVFEGLFQSQQRVDPVVVLALRDVGADLGSAVDQTLVLEDAQRLANSVAGD